MSENKNEFKIIRYRLRVGKPNTLLVQGWFTDNDIGENELLFLLDDKRLPVKITTKEGMEIRKKHLADSYGIDKEYYFWVAIPEKLRDSQFVRVFENKSGKNRLSYAIPCAKINKLRKKVDKYVENLKINDGKVTITGWYISVGDKADISIEGDKGQKISFDLKEVFRQDVKMEFPDAMDEQIHGFKIELEAVKDKTINIRIRDGAKASSYKCEIHPSALKKGVMKVNALCVKSRAYFNNNGLKKTIKRSIVKIFKLDENNYKDWMKKHRPTQEELEKQAHTEFKIKPKFSILVPAYKTPLNYLNEMIQSVQAQTYSNWELCLSDGSGVLNSALSKALEKYSKADERIKVCFSKEPLQISANTNMAMGLAEGDYIVFADHDDLLTPDALFECAKAINQYPDIDVLYSDEDKVSMDGKEYFDPHFKTDFNIDLLCSMNYICHLFVVKKNIVGQIGLLRSEYDGAQDYDFVLRSVEQAKHIYHIPKVLYHWRAHKDSTSENPESKLYAFEAGAKAVQAHYDRVGIKAKVRQGEYLGLYKTDHILAEHPMISIIIPNKDHIDDLDKCISSIESKTAYDNYEYIIVENNSEKEETFKYYKDLEQANSKVKVVYWKDEFNYSAINNFGAGFANGDYLLLLNNDTEIINDDCLEELLGYCMHDNVGAVGARLYYDDDTIQHAGVIVGFGGIAGHAFIGLPRSANGYFSRIICAQDLSAVTAACMMVKKSVFEEVGGFDENLKVAFNDIDLCMKIRNAGYLIVYNPYAELYHYESKSRGLEDTKEKVERFNSEIATFAGKWPDILKNGDPYYNPNLSMERCDFSLK